MQLTQIPKPAESSALRSINPEEIWRVIEKFIDEDTGVIYDTSLGRAALPSREEVLDDVPNQCGWMSDFEDAALNAGVLLPDVIRLAEETGIPEWRDRAWALSDLLLKLARVSDTRGFLARAVLPDGITHHRDSSTDQYTMAFHAFIALSRWSEAGEERQREAAHFAADAMQLLQKHGWDIPTCDGRVSWVGETSQFRPDRASRLLQFALTNAVLNQDESAMAEYRELRDEHHSRRTRHLFGGPDSISIPYALLQTQVSLRALWELEPDPEYRMVWRNHLNDLAENSASQLQTLDIEEIVQRISNLHSLPEPVAASDFYTAADYAGRHDIASVGDLGERYWQHNPRLFEEYTWVRGPLELAVCFGLADSPDLAGDDGQPLHPIVLEYVERIFEAIRLEDIRFCHSAVSLFSAASWLNSISR